jgi:hypothetical protein
MNTTASGTLIRVAGWVAGAAVMALPFSLWFLGILTSSPP